MKYLSLSIKSSIRLIAFFLLASGTASMAAQEKGTSFQIDRDYSVLLKSDQQEAQQLSDLKSVSNIEFFYWIGCRACYQVELGISRYLLDHPKLSIRRTPLVARTKWRPQAYLQPILSQLSSQLSESTAAPTLIDLYKQCLVDCKPFESYEASKLWLSKQIDEQQLPILDEESIWQAEKKFQNRADLFSITQVPTIIINERYKITAKQAKTTARLVEIIDYLISN